MFGRKDNPCGYDTLLTNFITWWKRLVHLSLRNYAIQIKHESVHQVYGAVVGDCLYFRLNFLNYLFLFIFIFPHFILLSFNFQSFIFLHFIFQKYKTKNQKKYKILKLFSPSRVIFIFFKSSLRLVYLFPSH